MGNEHDNIKIRYILDDSNKEYLFSELDKNTQNKISENVNKDAFKNFRINVFSEAPKQEVVIKIYPNNVFKCVLPNGNTIRYPIE